MFFGSSPGWGNNNNNSWYIFFAYSAAVVAAEVIKLMMVIFNKSKWERGIENYPVLGEISRVSSKLTIQTFKGTHAAFART